MARVMSNSSCCGLSEIDSLNGVTQAELATLIPHCRTMVIATVNEHQQASKKVLKNFGFKVMKRFKNRNSGNWVYLMGYDKSAQ